MSSQKRQKAELSQTNIMVNNMDPTLTKNDAPKVRAFFSTFGTIITATIHVTDANFYGPKTVFVEFQKEEDAEKCLNHYKSNKITHYPGGLPIAAKYSYRHSDPKNRKPKTPGNHENNKPKSNTNYSNNAAVYNQLQQQQLAALQLQSMYLMPQMYQQAYNPYMANASYQIPSLSLGGHEMQNIYSLDDPQLQQIDPTLLAAYTNMMANNMVSQMMYSNASGLMPMQTVDNLSPPLNQCASENQTDCDKR